MTGVAQRWPEQPIKPSSWAFVPSATTQFATGGVVRYSPVICVSIDQCETATRAVRE
jgi:hypothetical protein